MTVDLDLNNPDVLRAYCEEVGLVPGAEVLDLLDAKREKNVVGWPWYDYGQGVFRCKVAGSGDKAEVVNWPNLNLRVV